jgi:hypothetical protein
MVGMGSRLGPPRIPYIFLVYGFILVPRFVAHVSIEEARTIRSVTSVASSLIPKLKEADRSLDPDRFRVIRLDGTPETTSSRSICIAFASIELDE